MENEEIKEVPKEDEQVSPIEESKLVLKELKEQNQILKDQLKRAETLHAEQLLSGQASAGKQEVSEEAKAVQSARNLIKGSGFEDMVFPKVD